MLIFKPLYLKNTILNRLNKEANRFKIDEYFFEPVHFASSWLIKGC